MVYNKKNDKKGNKHVDKANIYIFFLKKKTRKHEKAPFRNSDKCINEIFFFFSQKMKTKIRENFFFLKKNRWINAFLSFF